MPPIPPLTKNLMLACTAVFCLQFVISLDRWFALWPLGSGLFMPWQVVTYAFLHAGFLHLLFNLATFVRFGPLLEGLYGTRRFLLALLITDLTGGLVSALGHQQVVASLGLSGVVFGLFGLLAGGYQRYRMYDGTQIRDQIVWLVIYTSVSLTWTAGIDHWCHLGGFLGGFAYAWFSRRPSGK